MNTSWIGLTAAAIALLLLYILASGVFLRLGLLIYPKHHEKRAEFLAEFYYVPRWARPKWVAGQLLRCVREGAPARQEARRDHRTRITSERYTRERTIFTVKVRKRTFIGTWQGASVGSADRAPTRDALLEIRLEEDPGWSRLSDPDAGRQDG